MPNVLKSPLAESQGHFRYQMFITLSSTHLNVGRVAVTDGMDSVAVNKLLTAGHDVIERHYTKDELLSGALSDFDAVIVRSAT